jgi:hypothetical protein
LSAFGAAPSGNAFGTCQQGVTATTLGTAESRCENVSHSPPVSETVQVTEL